MSSAERRLAGEGFSEVLRQAQDERIHIEVLRSNPPFVVSLSNHGPDSFGKVRAAIYSACRHRL